MASRVYHWIRKTDLITAALGLWCAVWVVSLIEAIEVACGQNLNQGIQDSILVFGSIISGGFAVRCVLNLLIGALSKNWPACEGRVTVIRLQNNGDGDCQETLYAVAEYSVDGIEFSTSRIGFGAEPMRRLRSTHSRSYSRLRVWPGTADEMATSKSSSCSLLGGQVNEAVSRMSHHVIDRFMCRISYCHWFAGTGVIVPGIAKTDVVTGLLFRLPLCALAW